jgi:hypothetical protein
LEPTPLGKIPKEDKNNIACENERAAEKERKEKNKIRRRLLCTFSCMVDAG